MRGEAKGACQKANNFFSFFLLFICSRIFKFVKFAETKKTFEINYVTKLFKHFSYI